MWQSENCGVCANILYWRIYYMDKYIFDEINGLWYELQEDYYIPCLILTEEETQPSLCFAVSFHKCLYIRITVISQNIGEFIQLFIKFGFSLLYLFFQSLSFLALENTRGFRKLLSQIRECDFLYLFDCFRLLLYL